MVFAVDVHRKVSRCIHTIDAVAALDAMARIRPRRFHDFRRGRHMIAVRCNRRLHRNRQSRHETFLFEVLVAFDAEDVAVGWGSHRIDRFPIGR